MPECRWGTQCQVLDCPFRHVAEEDRVECIFYRQGFCIHGPICRYRHIKLPAEECPEIADFSFQEEVVDEEGVKRRRTQPANEYFKTVMCKNWEAMGECPFGSECHFAHGKDELRAFPVDKSKTRKDGPEQGGGGFHSGPGHYGSTFGGGPTSYLPTEQTLPDLIDADGTGPDLSKNVYFMARSFDYKNLLEAQKKGIWGATPDIIPALNNAFETQTAVFIFVTVNQSRHFQALLKMTSTVRENAPAAPVGVPVQEDTNEEPADGPDGESQGRNDLERPRRRHRDNEEEDDDKDRRRGDRRRDRDGRDRGRDRDSRESSSQRSKSASAPRVEPFNEPPAFGPIRDSNKSWQWEFSVEVVRMTEVPNSDLVFFFNPMDQNMSVVRGRNFQQMPFDLGHELVIKLYESKELPLDEQEVMSQESTEEIAYKRRELVAPEQSNGSAPFLSYGAEGGDDNSGPHRFKTIGNGFMFACNNHTIDEVFTRMLIGSTKEHEQQTKAVRPGMTLFLVNMADRTIMGIFQAVSHMVVNMEPDAFTRNPNQNCPFPVQVRFAVVLEVPPIPETDPAIKEVLGEKGIKLGQMRADVVQKLADVLAEKAGKEPSEQQQIVSETIPVPIEADNDFQVIGRLRGVGDEHIARIEGSAGNKTRITFGSRSSQKKKKPEGSNTTTSTTEDSNEPEKDPQKSPVWVQITSDSGGSLKIACDLMGELIARTCQEYSQFMMERATAGAAGGFRGPPGPMMNPSMAAMMAAAASGMAMGGPPGLVPPAMMGMPFGAGGGPPRPPQGRYMPGMGGQGGAGAPNMPFGSPGRGGYQMGGHGGRGRGRGAGGGRGGGSNTGRGIGGPPPPPPSDGGSGAGYKRKRT